MTKILVADDAVISHGSITAVLESFGYEVVEARTENDCLSVLAKENCDLLVTDMDMPQKRGMNLLRSVCRQAPNLPVIAIFGHDEEEKVSSFASSVGARETIQKPFKANELIDRIKQILS